MIFFHGAQGVMDVLLQFMRGFWGSAVTDRLDLGYTAALQYVTNNAQKTRNFFLP
jgi:hypothetical protein